VAGAIVCGKLEWCYAVVVDVRTMPTISADAALAVVPFFVPLIIVVCCLFYALARGQISTHQRLTLLEAKVVMMRSVSATVPRLPKMPRKEMV
jgi:hypothetical protein